MVKKELLDSIIENDGMPGFEERVQSITDNSEAIIIIKKYDELIWTQKKKIINIVGIQG